MIDFNQCQALQQGAVVALSDHADWPANLLPIYRERRDRTLAALTGLGWSVPSPSMALYLWMPLPAWARAQGCGD